MDLKTAQAIVDSTPALSGIERIDPLEEGFSPDRKFILVRAGRPEFVLRLSNEMFADRRRGEFELLERLTEHRIRSPEPVCFGAAPGGGVFTAVAYLPGENAEVVLPRLNSDPQYALGISAGRLLRMIHTLAPEDRSTDWIGRHRKMFERGLQAAADVAVDVPGLRTFVAYIEAHSDSLSDASPRLMHNDFYPANLLVERDELSGVLDFELWD